MLNNIPEERVPGLLARAAELDRQTITIDALRAAALEAGISAAAFDQAVAEYAQGGNTPVLVPRDIAAEKPRRDWRYWLGRAAEPLKLGALALVLGIMGAGTVTLATIAVCWLIGTAGYLSWRDRGTGNPARFQADTLVMSALMFFGMLGAGGDEDALGFVALFTITLLILGTLIVHFGGEREDVKEVSTQ